MRVLEYRQVVNLRCEISDETAVRLARDYEGNYGEDDDALGSLRNCINSLERQLSAIMSVLGRDLKGKSILDLGCGEFPWLCRLLYQFGARPIGVSYDRPNNVKFAGDIRERFEHYPGVDLVKFNSLDFLPDKSVDLANAHWLFDSPSLLNRYWFSSLNLRESLILQLPRILKPEAVFIHEEVEGEGMIFISEA